MWSMQIAIEGKFEKFLVALTSTIPNLSGMQNGNASDDCNIDFISIAILRHSGYLFVR
jgi:L-cysteine desulfidase